MPGEPALYDGVTDILITHKHGDHFSKDSVLRIAEKQKIRLGCDRRVAEAVGEHENIEFVLLKPLEEKKFGCFTVLPLMANHDIAAEGDNYAFHYIITTLDGKTLFYGLDGAWFIRPSWNAMLKYKFDVSVFDCTVGDRDDWRMFEHNTIPMLRVMIKEMKAQNIIADGGKLVASHLARTLHPSHEETEKILSAEGMITAYDGMSISF